MFYMRHRWTKHTWFHWYINHSLINTTSTAPIKSCVYIFRNCGVSGKAFPFSPPPSLLCFRPNFFEDLVRKLLLRRLPAEVLNVMITAVAKNKVKTVIRMRIVQKTGGFNMVVSTRVGRGRVFTSRMSNFLQSRWMKVHNPIGINRRLYFMMRIS